MKNTTIFRQTSLLLATSLLATTALAQNSASTTNSAPATQTTSAAAKPEEKSPLGRFGLSLVFDTNFNFYADRQKLREVAAEQSALSLVVWITTVKSIAKTRATQNAHAQGTRVLGDMSPETFERMSDSLEPPHPDERSIQLDGTKISVDYVRAALQL